MLIQRAPRLSSTHFAVMHSTFAIQSAINSLTGKILQPKKLDQLPLIDLSEEDRETLTARYLEIMAASPSITLDQLSLIHGDAIRKNSDLDNGGNLTTNAQLLMAIIENPPSTLRLDLDLIKKQLTELIYWGTELSRLKTEVTAEPLQLEHLTPLATQICSRLRSLNKGQNLTLPGGYTNKTGGHALIYEIIKTDTDQFDFHIINTGSGIQYHFNALQGLKNKIAPLFTLSGITIEDLTGATPEPRIDFFLTLLGFECNSFGAYIDVQQIYNAICVYFPGKKSSQTELITDNLITPQRSGTCSWKCLMALTRHTMSKDDYKKLVFFIKQTTLISFFKTQKELLQDDTIKGRQARNFLKLITQKLSLRSSKTLSQKSCALTLEEAKTSQALIETILLTIHRYQENIYESKTLKTYLLNSERMIHETITWPASTLRVPLDQSLLIPIPLLPQFNFDSHSFLENLTKSQSYLTHYAKSPSLQRELILALIKAAPSPLNTAYYKRIPLEDILEILLGLFTYLKSYMIWGIHNNFCITIDKITLFSLHALCLELSLNYEEKKQIESLNRLSKIFSIDLNSEHLLKASNLIHLPGDIKRWGELTKYFERFKDDRIIHQSSYTITERNPKPSSNQESLGYLFYGLTQRNSHAVNICPTSVQGTCKALEFTAQLIADLTKPQWPRVSDQPFKLTFFDALDLPHLQILKTSSFYIQYLLEGRFNAVQGTQQSMYQIIKPQPGSLDFSYTLKYPSDTKSETPWTSYGHLTLTTPLAQVSVQKARSKTILFSSYPFAWEAISISAKTPLQSNPDHALFDPINHALSHNSLRPIELLNFVSTHLKQFTKNELRVHFLQQFFKLPHNVEGPATELFELIEDDKFQIAFLDFLLSAQNYGSKKGKDNFSIFTFVMQIGVLLLPHVQQDSFKEAICTQLAVLHEQLALKKDPQELYTLHLLIGLKNAFILQKLLVKQAPSASVAEPTHPDLSDSDLKSNFYSLLMSWMMIKTNQQDLKQFNHIYRILEDHFYEIFTAHPSIYMLIDQNFLQKIVKKTINLDLNTATYTPSTQNPLICIFNDQNQTCVDLYTGSISNKNGPVTLTIYDQVYNIPLFQEVFGTRKDFKFTYNIPWYSFQDPVLGSFRVQNVPQFLLEKQIAGSWAKLIGPYHLHYLCPALTTLKSQTENFCPILTRDYFLYEQEAGFYFFSKDKSSSAYFIPRNGTTLKIQKIDPNSLQLISELIPAKFLSQDFQQLISRFEDPSFVYLEKNEHSTKLVFIRYRSHSKPTPLTFVLSGDNWLLESNQSKKLCTQFPDTLMGDFNSFLVVETIITKQQSALIPSLPYKKRPFLPSFAGGGELDINQKDGETTTLSRTYDELPLHGDELKPATPEDKLCAFRLEVGQRDLEGALIYLKQISTSDLQTKAKQKQVETCLYFLTNIDQSPQSIALQMQLNYFLYYYNFMNGTFPPDDVQNLYRDYCELLAHIPFHFRLSLEQESLILQMMIKSKPKTTQQPSTSLVLPDFIQARIASCPQLIPRDQQNHLYYPKLTTLSEPIPADQPNFCLDFSVFQPNISSTNQQTTHYLWRLKHYTSKLDTILQNLSLTTVMGPESGNLIYDLIYHVRKNPTQKAHLNKLFYLAHYLIKSPHRHNPWLNFIFILNHSRNDSDPRPLLDYLRNKPSSSKVEPHIEEWKKSLSSYFISIGRPIHNLMQQPSIRLTSNSSLPQYLHLAVITPPPPESALSWDQLSPSFDALKTLSDLKSQLIQKEKFIPFIYGLPPVQAEMIESLKAVVTGQSAPQMAKAIETEFDDFIQGFTSITEDERLIPSLSTQELKIAEQALDGALAKTQKLLEDLLGEVFTLAHARHEDPIQALIQSGLRIKKLTLQQLLFLVISSNQEAFIKACPHLKSGSIQHLYNTLSQYLYIGIHFSQMNRLKTTMNALSNALTTTELSSVAQSLASDGRMLHPDIVSKALELKTILQQTLVEKSSPQHLVFQYTSQLMFRTSPDQESLIKGLSSSSHNVAQVIMGGGKTTVIAANLLAKACSEGKIAIMITPSFQYQSLYKTMQHTLKTIFGIEVITFHYTREELTLAKLEALEHTLLSIQNSAAHQEPKVLLLRPETLQLLTLEYLYTLKQIATQGPILSEDVLMVKFKTLNKILTLLKTKGYALGDEVHVLLDITKEIYIPVGQLHTVDQENISLISTIFKIIDNFSIPLTAQEKTELEEPFTETERANLVYHKDESGYFMAKIDQFLKLRQNKQSYFSTKLYREILLPKIASLLATDSSLMIPDRDQQVGFCHYIQGSMKGSLQKTLDKSPLPHISNETDRNDLQFLDQIKRLHHSSDPQEKKTADLISLSKYILGDLLPSLLSKTGKVHFGRTRNENTPGKVVPYICADTPSDNEFGNHYEAIVYHFMSALMLGVEDDQIKNLFSSWHKEATDMSTHLSYEKTHAAVLCQELFGILPYELDEKFEQIKTSLTNNTPKALNQLFAIEQHTLDRYVRYQKEKLHANAHSLVALCAEFHGLSGTPDSYTLSKALLENSFLDTTVNPLCIRAFLEKTAKVFVSAFTSVDSFIDENFAKLTPTEQSQTYALLDAGGVFKDFDNELVAQTLLKKLQRSNELKAIVFFTRLDSSPIADFPVLMRVGGTEKEPLNGTTVEELLSKGLHVGDYAIYLDSRHCTGIDIKLPQNAFGLLTYDPSMGLDDTTQGLMRLRNYLINQSLAIIVPEYTCSCFPKTDTPFKDLVQTNQNLEAKKILVAQMITKQVDQRSRKMIKSFRKMLEDSLLQDALTLLDSQRDDPIIIKKIIHGFTSSLICRSDDTPYQSFGSLSEEVDIIESLKKTSEKLLAQLKKDLTAAQFSQYHKTLTINKIIGRISDNHGIILNKALEIKCRFISTVMDPILGETPASEGVEKEMHAFIEQQTAHTQEANQQIEQATEIELTGLQSHSTPSPRCIPLFDASKFLTQVNSSNPVQEGMTEPLKNLFEVSLSHYAPLFDESPLLITTDFKQPYNESTNLFDTFHVQARPFQHLFICQRSDQSYQAVIVSEFESSELTNYLRSKPELTHVWLTEPDGHLQAGNLETWQACRKNDLIKTMMLTFNLLGGNAQYLHAHLDQYTQWYLKQDQKPSTGGVASTGGVDGSTLSLLKLRFLKLIAATHPLAKDIMLNYLIPHEALMQLSMASQRLRSHQAFDEISSSILDKSNVENLSFTQIRNLAPEHVTHIGEFLTLKQIPYLSDPCVVKLPLAQLQHLHPSQVRCITTQTQIKALPCELIAQLQEKDLKDTTILENLNEKQYGALKDPNLINKVPDLKLPYIDPQMTPHVGPFIHRLRHLNKKHFYYLSVEQLQAFTSEIDSRDLFAQLPLEAIAQLPLTEPRRANGQCFIAYLNPEQQAMLTFNQISLIKSLRDLSIYLSPNLWQHANRALLQQLTSDNIKKIPPEGITAQLLENLTQTQYDNFTKPQVQGISTPDKFQFLSNEQLAWLSSEQIQFITDKNLLIKIDPSQWGHAPTNIIEQLDYKDLPLITSENYSIDLLKKLTTKQLYLIQYDNILPTIALEHFSTELLEKFPTCYSSHFTKQQIGAIPTKELFVRLIINTALWEHGSDRIIKALTQQDLLKCSLQEMTNTVFLSKLSPTQLKNLTEPYVQQITDPFYLDLCNPKYLSPAQKTQQTKKHTWIQFFSMHPSQLKYYNWIQTMAFTVGQLAKTFFYLTLAPLIITAKSLTTRCSIPAIERHHQNMWATLKQFQALILQEEMVNS